MTNIHDQKHFNFDFLWVLRGSMIQTIKMKIIVLIQKVEILKMVSKMAAN